MQVPETKEEVTVSWLNEVFQKHGITVHDFTFVGQTGQNRGFMGTLEQVDLTVSHHTDNNNSDKTELLRVVFKTLPSDPFRKTFASSAGFTTREITVYTDILKRFDAFMDSRNVPLEHRFRHPICYYGAESGEGETYKCILILEHLTGHQSPYTLWHQGFSEPLPMTAALAVIRQIARWHATGIAYKMANKVDSYYKLFPNLKHALYPAFQYIWDLGFATARQVIKDHVDKEEIPEGLWDQLDKLQGDEGRDLVLSFCKDIHMSRGDKATICHHDLHSNNLVLAQDHSDAIIFDYQACCVFNPMKDLSFFIIQNCDMEDKTELQKAIEVYHEEFHKTMTACRVPFTYTMESIRRDYDRYFAFSLSHIITGAPIWLDGNEIKERSKRRFAMAVINAYKRGILKYPSTV